MKYNVHLLQHLPDFFKRYGALWAWSAFPPEHYNGVLKKLFHGTQCVPQQLAKTYDRLRTVKYNSDVFSDESCSEKGKKIFVGLMKQCNVSNSIDYGNNLRVFGKGRKKKLSVTEKLITEQLLENNIEDYCLSYQRFIYQHILYHSNSYKRLKKRNNSVLLTTDEIILSIQKLITVKTKTTQDMKFIVIGEKFDITREEFFKYNEFSSNSFSFVAEKTSTICCCEITSLKSKCVCIEYDQNKLYVIPLGNRLETD